MRINYWSSDVCSSDLEAFGPVGIVDPGDLHQLLIVQCVAKLHPHAGNGVSAHGDAILADSEVMRDQVLAEQGLQCVGDTLARRDQGSGASHSQPPFGLSLSKPRPWRVNEKRKIGRAHV